MKAVGVSSECVFTRNPLVLTSELWPEFDLGTSPGRLQITVGGQRVFEGRFYPPLHMDVSGILDASVPFLPEAVEDRVVSLIEGADRMEAREVEILAVYEGVSDSFRCVCLPGGVPPANFNILAAVGKDIFDSRYVRPIANFLLTTRGRGRTVYIPETELYPLYFLGGYNSRGITVTAPICDDTWAMSFKAPGVYALDINALRKELLLDSGVLCSVFDISLDDEYMCRIVIGRSDSQVALFKLKYRTALGVFELMELHKAPTATTQWEETSRHSYKSRTQNDIYTVSGQDRSIQECDIDVSLIANDETHLFRIMDLSSSEEVYLLGEDMSPIKLIPTTEKITVPDCDGYPLHCKLTFSVANTLGNTQHRILSPNEYSYGIFTPPFDKPFA